MRFSFQRIVKFGVALYMLGICTGIYQLTSEEEQFNYYSAPLIMADDNSLPLENPLSNGSMEFPGDNCELEDDDDSARNLTIRLIPLQESSIGLLMLSYNSYLANQQEISTPPPRS